MEIRAHSLAARKGKSATFARTCFPFIANLTDLIVRVSGGVMHFDIVLPC